MLATVVHHKLTSQKHTQTKWVHQLYHFRELCNGWGTYHYSSVCNKWLYTIIIIILEENRLQSLNELAHNCLQKILYKFYCLTVHFKCPTV